MRSLFCSSIIAFTLIAFSVVATAQTSVPYTFTAGTTAIASEVNADFQALAATIDTLSVRVAKLEGQITASDLVGTYALTGIETEVTTQSNYRGWVSIKSLNATVTLAGNGMGTVSGHSFPGYMFVVDVPSITPITLGRTGGATPLQNLSWSLSGSSITMLGGTFSIVPGGKLLISSTTDPVKQTIVLLLLTKIN